MLPPTDLNNPLRHHALAFSAHLGELSASLSTASPQPTQLSAVPARFLQRSRAQQHAAQKLKATEFLAGG
jgi:hypothetical protein